MTPKEYLNQAYALDRKAALLIAKTDKLRDSLFGKAVQLDGVSVKGGSCSDVMGETVAKVADYEAKTAELIGQLIDKRLEIESVIASIPDPDQREVLERRYLLYQPWDSYYDKHTGVYVKGIYESMNYSRRQIFRLHGAALQSVTLDGIEWHL